MKLSNNQLNDKSSPGISQLLSLSFEYMLSCIVLEYSILTKKNTVDDFNVSNQISPTKTLLYPFFVSLSNGHSKSLFNLFGKFYALSFGPISFDVFNIFKNDIGNHTSLKYFKINSDFNQLGIEILSNKLGTPCPKNLKECVDLIKSNIKNTTIDFNTESATFSDVIIESDLGKDKALFEAIESGINAIKGQSDKFFISDAEIIKLHASYFEAFKDRYNSNDVSVIEYDEIEEGKRRPFYLNLEESVQQ